MQAEGTSEETPGASPGRITGFEVQGKRRPRILVMIDGEPWEVLDAETVVREGLRTGQALDAAGRARVLRADAVILARRAAGAWCARGPRTRRELEQYLRDKKFTADVAAEAIAALERDGVLDEAASVDRSIRRRRRGGYGPRRIEAELMARGIGASTAARRVDAALEGVDLRAECDEQAERLARRYRPLTDAASRRKLAQALLRRGYEGEMVRAAVERLCRREGADAEDLDGGA